MSATHQEPAERVARWMADLNLTLDSAALLVKRGRDAFDSDPAVPLAFEALSNRVGELSKRMMSADPARFTDPIWAQAARNRDFVGHHYDRVDAEMLWVTVSTSFPLLRAALERVEHTA